MVLVDSSQHIKALKFFSSKLYKIRALPFRTRSLDFLIQNFRLFTTPSGGGPNDDQAPVGCSLVWFGIANGDGGVMGHDFFSREIRQTMGKKSISDWIRNS